MSLILKGIDLPKEGELHLIISKNGIICGAEYPNNIKHAYPLNLEAEAIQIPKNHGRLIDADVLELEKEVELADDWKTAHEIANCVKYAPTILEAEE